MQKSLKMNKSVVIRKSLALRYTYNQLLNYQTKKDFNMEKVIINSKTINAFADELQDSTDFFYYPEDCTDFLTDYCVDSNCTTIDEVNAELHNYLREMYDYSNEYIMENHKVIEGFLQTLKELFNENNVNKNLQK